VSVLGALSIGFVLGLAIVSAVLLRNEDEVRKAWRKRRGIVEPEAPSVEPGANIKSKAPPIGPWHVAMQGLLVILLVRFAVSDGSAFSIVVAALSIPAFGVSLFRYRRSRCST
jgi:hypothetical protein